MPVPENMTSRKGKSVVGGNVISRKGRKGAKFFGWCGNMILTQREEGRKERE